MVSTGKHSLAKSVRRQTPTLKETRDALQALRSTVMRLKREHAELKREFATMVVEVSGASRPIDAAFDEHDLRVMREVQEGIAEYYRKTATTGK